jgi:hypothetical protein
VAAVPSGPNWTPPPTTSIKKKIRNGRVIILLINLNGSERKRQDIFYETKAVFLRKVENNSETSQQS